MNLAIAILTIVSTALYGLVWLVEKADAATVARRLRASEIHAQRQSAVDWDSLPPGHVRRSLR
jgi:hypothetical protein